MARRINRSTMTLLSASKPMVSLVGYPSPATLPSRTPICYTERSEQPQGARSWKGEQRHTHGSVTARMSPHPLQGSFEHVPSTWLQHSGRTRLELGPMSDMRAPHHRRRLRTQRWRARARDAERRVRLLSALMPGIIFEFDEAMRYVGVWTSDPALLARPEPELIGLTVIEAIGEEIGRPFEARLRRMFETGVPEEFEYVLDVAGGRRAFAWNAVPWHGGRRRRLALQIRDLTNEVHMKPLLRAAGLGGASRRASPTINNPGVHALEPRAPPARPPRDGAPSASCTIWSRPWSSPGRR